jgi:hypothetical protein
LPSLDYWIDLAIVEVLSIGVGIWVYDWFFDEVTDRIVKRLKNKFIKKRKILEKQGIT